MKNIPTTLSVSILWLNMLSFLVIFFVKFCSNSNIITSILCVLMFYFNLLLTQKKYRLIKDLGNFSFRRVVIIDSSFASLANLLMFTEVGLHWCNPFIFLIFAWFYYPMIKTNKKIPPEK